MGWIIKLMLLTLVCCGVFSEPEVVEMLDNDQECCHEIHGIVQSHTIKLSGLVKYEQMTDRLYDWYKRTRDSLDDLMDSGLSKLAQVLDEEWVEQVTDKMHDVDRLDISLNSALQRISALDRKVAKSLSSAAGVLESVLDRMDALEARLAKIESPKIEIENRLEAIEKQLKGLQKETLSRTEYNQDRNDVNKFVSETEGKLQGMHDHESLLENELHLINSTQRDQRKLLSDMYHLFESTALDFDGKIEHMGEAMQQKIDLLEQDVVDHRNTTTIELDRLNQSLDKMGDRIRDLRLIIPGTPNGTETLFRVINYVNGGIATLRSENAAMTKTFQEAVESVVTKTQDQWDEVDDQIKILVHEDNVIHKSIHNMKDEHSQMIKTLHKDVLEQTTKEMNKCQSLIYDHVVDAQHQAEEFDMRLNNTIDKFDAIQVQQRQQVDTMLLEALLTKHDLDLEKIKEVIHYVNKTLEEVSQGYSELEGQLVQLLKMEKLVTKLSEKLKELEDSMAGQKVRMSEAGDDVATVMGEFRSVKDKVTQLDTSMKHLQALLTRTSANTTDSPLIQTTTFDSSPNATVFELPTAEPLVESTESATEIETITTISTSTTTVKTENSSPKNDINDSDMEDAGIVFPGGGSEERAPLTVGRRCSSTGEYSFQPGIDEWCQTNCNHDPVFCPENRCVCYDL